MKITVATWFDTITNESRENCDYESTGNEYREFEFDSLDEAVDFASDHVGYVENESDLRRLIAGIDSNVVLYPSDGVIDYRSGSADFYTASISVESDESK